MTACRHMLVMMANDHETCGMCGAFLCHNNHVDYAEDEDTTKAKKFIAGFQEALVQEFTKGGNTNG